MKKLLGLIFMGVVGSGLVLGDVPSVYAQESDIDKFTLEEITVTAQKREENQQKVPIAMEVISGEEMKELGRNNFYQMFSNLSSVFINTQQDGMRVSIRGMSDDASPIGTLGHINNDSPMVAVHTDGVFSTSRGGVGLYDIERVEVMFGPQSTLYSTTSPAGIVNIVTADPKTDQYEMSGSFKYGNYRHLQTEGMMNAPIGESAALRLAYSSSRRDGYMKRGEDDEDRQSGRFKILLKPNDRFSFMGTVEYTRTGGYGSNGRPDFVNENALADPWDNTGLTGISPVMERLRDSYSPKIYANMVLNLDYASLTFIPTYSTTDYHHEMADEYYGYNTSETLNSIKREKGAELRITSSPDFPFEWVIGGNIYEGYQFQDFWRYFEEPDFSFPMNRGTRQETKAIYGNITYPLTDKFRLTGGGRWSSDKSTATQHSFIVQATYLNIIGLQEVEAHNVGKYEKPDFKFGVEYDIGPDSMLYADVSSGYRVVPVPVRGEILESEEMMAYTIGSKNRFFGNKFQVNAAAYVYQYENMSADAGRGIWDPATWQQDLGTSTYGNMRKAGVDLQTSTILGRNDTFDFSISYLDSEFTDLYFDFVSPILPDFDASGYPETFSSKWTLSGVYEKNFNLMSGGTLAARIESRYKTGYLIQYANWEQDRSSADSSEWFIYDLGEGILFQEPHHISNCSLTYTNPDGRWSVSGYVDNIEDYAVKLNRHMMMTYIGPPRTYGAVFSIRF